jgi:ATP-binding cassette subfamily F protein uup
VFAKDAREGTRLTERYAEIEEELLIALERWDELENRRK